MNENQIMKAIGSLAQCQGFYTRLYNSLSTMKECDPEDYHNVMESLVSQNFKDEIDLVMYLET